MDKKYILFFCTLVIGMAGFAMAEQVGSYSGDFAVSSGNGRIVIAGPGQPGCGDNILQTYNGEQCDGTDLGGKTCSSLGYDSGTLSCRADCSYDVSNCRHTTTTIQSPTTTVSSASGGSGGGSGGGSATTTIANSQNTFANTTTTVIGDGNGITNENSAAPTTNGLLTGLSTDLIGENGEVTMLGMGLIALLIIILLAALYFLVFRKKKSIYELNREYTTAAAPVATYTATPLAKKRSYSYKPRKTKKKKPAKKKKR